MPEQIIMSALVQMGAVGILIWFGWYVHKAAESRAKEAAARAEEAQRNHLSDLRDMLAEQHASTRALAAAAQTFERGDQHNTQAITNLQATLERLDQHTVALSSRIDAILQKGAGPIT